MVDIDATMITAHSDKEGAAGTFNSGFGFHPLTRGRALLAQLRGSRAGTDGVVAR